MFIGWKDKTYILPCWRNGSVFVLHTNGSGSIPLRGTKKFYKKFGS